ncbi:hypothetical protein MHH52_13765 [Paenibacillus sp. FSL K6-0276]
MYKVLIVTKNIPYFTPKLMDLLYELILTTTEQQSIQKTEK